MSKLVTKLGRLNVIQTNAPSVPYSGSGYLDKLKKAGKIRHVGATKKGHWEIIE